MKIDKGKIEDHVTLESIKRDYPNKDRYRVSGKKIEPQTRYSGMTSEGLFFMLSGSCTFKYNDFFVEVKARDKFTLPKGRYVFETNGNETVEFVQVWDLHQIIKNKNGQTT